MKRKISNTQIAKLLRKFKSEHKPPYKLDDSNRPTFVQIVDYVRDSYYKDEQEQEQLDKYFTFRVLDIHDKIRSNK